MTRMMKMKTKMKRREMSKETGKKSKAPEKKKYEGPRSVRAYGQELFVELNPNVELEVIRKRIVEEFHYPEYSKERTSHVLR